MKPNPIEFIRVKNLCELFDCDRGTIDRILHKAAESHDIPVLTWNGQRRVHLPSFRRFLMEQMNLTF
jgi:hypothetical protein